MVEIGFLKYFSWVPTGSFHENDNSFAKFLAGSVVR